MTRFQTITDLAVDNAMPESWVDAVRINVAYLTVAGSDLTSGSTINPTAGFHKVTGTTTINNIVDLSGASKGQPLMLYFTGSLTLHHNGGGAGQLFLPGLADRKTIAGDVIEFVYDNTGDQWVMISDKLVSAMSQLAADVTATVAGTFYDTATLSLTPGTWLLFGCFTAGFANHVWTAKITDGSTVGASQEAGVSGSVQGFMSLFCRVVITSTTTWKLQVANTVGGGVIKAATVTSGQGNNATTLVAVRVQ